MHCFTGCAVQRDTISDLGGLSPSGTASPCTPIGKAFKAVLGVKPGAHGWASAALLCAGEEQQCTASLSLCPLRGAGSACVPQSGLSPVPLTHTLSPLTLWAPWKSPAGAEAAGPGTQLSVSQTTKHPEAFCTPRVLGEVSCSCSMSM